jgi:hypothetical protein
MRQERSPPEPRFRNSSLTAQAGEPNVAPYRAALGSPAMRDSDSPSPGPFPEGRGDDR